ncbi:DNA methyltransferase [Pseudoxanthomonas winnipegensis]|uniref:DNA methyltransferase n=1 Tax=Pseudoxanthomonas winnipegensis TaxID=2480810 RepID=UPI001D18A2A4|nr:DNA methyltransferase [Pseudoxanthomonas winnipegensis]
MTQAIYARSPVGYITKYASKGETKSGAHLPHKARLWGYGGLLMSERGDVACLEVLRAIPEGSVDAIVTDPPYGIAFMGKRWDYDVPSTEIWAECLRVLKPGGHLLAFAGTRTQHRMAVRIEDAGFEIRDMIAWVYGSGFPKSHNGVWGGTALKPALEPITMARKSLNGTVALNHASHGTGGLNIDACRVDGIVQSNAGNIGFGSGRIDGYIKGTGREYQANGRWPANLIHDGSEEVLEAFPNAPGQLANTSANHAACKTQNVYGAMRRGRGEEPSADSSNEGAVGFKMRPGIRRLDGGSAARFFYCAKASRLDRDEGLEALARQAAGMVSNTSGQHMTRRDEGYEVAPRANHHPTVKPTDLMRYLCRLVTPAGAVVLDPFMGSGSTGKAALLDRFSFIGVERDEQYFNIALARISAALHETDQDDRYLRKGSLVTIEGKLRTERWQASDGSDRYSAWIYCDPRGLTLHGGREHARTGVEHQGRSSAPPGRAPAQPQPGDVDDDIPF